MSFVFVINLSSGSQGLVDEWLSSYTGIVLLIRHSLKPCQTAQ